MPTPLADVVRLAERRCPSGAAVPGVASTANFVEDALARLNDVAPREVKVVLTGDSTDEYAFGEDWSDGFSAIKRIRWVPSADFAAPAQWFDPEDYEVEYTRTLVSSEAVGTGDAMATVFALDEPFATDEGATVTVAAATQGATTYRISGGASGSQIEFTAAPANAAAIVASYYTASPQIRFFPVVPTSSDKVVIEHTAPHVLTDTATTINANDLPFLADLAAAMKLEAAAVAVLAVRDQDTEDDVALIDQGGRAEALERQAKRLRASFNAHFGIATGTGTGAAAAEESPASFAFADVDIPLTASRQFRHTHSRGDF